MLPVTGLIHTTISSGTSDYDAFTLKYTVKYSIANLTVPPRGKYHDATGDNKRRTAC